MKNRFRLKVSKETINLSSFQLMIQT